MKKNRQVLYAVIAAIILVAVGYLGYTQLVPHSAASSKSGTTVEVVAPIQSGLNQQTLAQLTNISETKDFSIQLDLTGIGNTNPFGQ